MAQTTKKRAVKQKKPKLAKHPGTSHEEKNYVFRFRNNFEFGLGGITGYSIEDNDYVWYDKNGWCLRSPKENVVLFGPQPDKPPEQTEDPTDNLEKHIKDTHPPDFIKDKIAEVSHTEAQRYLMRNRDGQRTIVDTDNPTHDLDFHEKDAGPFGDLVKLANEAVEAKKNGGYRESILEEGMQISILDLDKSPSMSMTEEAFQQAINNKEFSNLQLPVIQKPNGDHYRIEVSKEGERFFRRCEMKMTGAEVEDASG